MNKRNLLLNNQILSNSNINSDDDNNKHFIGINSLNIEEEVKRLFKNQYFTNKSYVKTKVFHAIFKDCSLKTEENFDIVSNEIDFLTQSKQRNSNQNSNNNNNKTDTKQEAPEPVFDVDADKKFKSDNSLLITHLKNNYRKSDDKNYSYPIVSNENVKTISSNHNNTSQNKILNSLCKKRKILNSSNAKHVDGYNFYKLKKK